MTATNTISTTQSAESAGRKRAPRKMPRQSPASKTEYTGFRMTEADLAAIDERAQALGLTRTQYVTDAALERLPQSGGTIHDELAAINRRLKRLEDLAFG